MDPEILIKIKQVLNEWNPLGENASKIHDLNEYETEANDILFYIDFDVTSKKPEVAKKQLQKLINTVITQAFKIDLSDEDCKTPTEKIYQILYHH